MIHQVRHCIERHFSLILALSFFLGLIIPGIDRLSPHVITLILVLLIFFSCFKLDFAQLRRISILQCAYYYFSRFIVLPIAFYLLAKLLIPSYAAGIFLIVVMPAGVAAPAVAALFSGNVSLTITLVTASSILAPFIVPFLVLLLLGTDIQIDTLGMFYTLSTVVFLPLIVHYPLRGTAVASRWIEPNANAFSVLLIGAVIVVAFGLQRDYFFSNTSVLLDTLLISAPLYVLLYLLGWLLVPGSTEADRLAFSISSGANNIALGVTLGLLYFPPHILLFLVLSQATWVLALVIFKRRIAFRGIDSSQTGLH